MDFYDLYLQCFPDYPCSRETFYRFMQPDQATILAEHQPDGKLIAYAMIWGNSISLLCVASEHRRKGIGARLLRQAEEHIAKTGAEKVILGQGSHYLLQGVPAGTPEAIAFFEKRGYSARWTSANMELLLEKFDYEALDIPPVAHGVSFRFATEADREALLSAVAVAEPNWRGIFETCRDPILLATGTTTDRILGFVILDPNGGRFGLGKDRVGSVGCVGVIPSAREKGIGRRMVAKGIDWLKPQGCRTIELLYLELVDWYSTLGFEVTDWQWMGEKTLA